MATITDFLSRPEIANGFLAASQAVNSQRGYGNQAGWLTNGLIGFGAGMKETQAAEQAKKQKDIEDQAKLITAYAAMQKANQPNYAITNNGQYVDKNNPTSGARNIPGFKGQGNGQAIIPDLTDVEDLNQQADIIEGAANQNLSGGNKTAYTQQMTQSRSLRTQANKQEQLINTDVQKLSKNLEESGFNELVGSLEKASNLINEKKDIEGAGAGAVLPGFALSPEGQDLRSAIATVRNSILKARSGGAVTPGEADRLLEEIGTGIGKSDSQLRIGLKNATDILKSKVQNIKAGATEKGINRYIENYGSNPFDRLNNIVIKDFSNPNTALTSSNGVKFTIERPNK